MTLGNTSSAVRMQRTEPKSSLDDFPTPPWATRALIKYVLSDHISPDDIVDEPCCNRGFMARPLIEVFPKLRATDIKDYGFERMIECRDYTFPQTWSDTCEWDEVDWVITNPPFVHLMRFIEIALERARKGVALFLRQNVMSGVTRYNGVYKTNPITIYAPFSERVVLHKGVMLDPDELYWVPPKKDKAGEYRKPSTATDYAWFVFLKGKSPMPPVIIPPCRRELTRQGDYPGNPQKPDDAETSTREGVLL